ncbi:MAG: hypothetical protein OQJ81_07790 [Melioribacteraceae bacterium]|nr:hypothetical protein [Melioribacteraceae bacterium]
MEILSHLHPLVIHFPIAFLLLFILFEISNLFIKNINLKKISILILFFGVIGGIVAVLSGNQAFQILETKSWLSQHHKYIIEQHEYYASITMWYFFAILVFEIYTFLKSKKEIRRQYLFVIFALIGLYLLYQTANIGGILVYKLGIGTDLLK